MSALFNGEKHIVKSMKRRCIFSDMLAKIENAAAGTVGILDIGKEIGVPADSWAGMLRDPDIRLAIAKGRADSQLKANAALMACATLGSASAALIMLQLNFGWPRPRRGRPRRGPAPKP